MSTGILSSASDLNFIIATKLYENFDAVGALRRISLNSEFFSFFLLIVLNTVIQRVNLRIQSKYGKIRIRKNSES